METLFKTNNKLQEKQINKYSAVWFFIDLAWKSQGQLKKYLKKKRVAVKEFVLKSPELPSAAELT